MKKKYGCSKCGREFESSKAIGGHVKGKHSKSDGINNKVELVCKTCNKKFFKYPSDVSRYNSKFCSQKCYGLSRRGKIIPWNKGLSSKTNEKVRKNVVAIIGINHPMRDPILREKILKALLKSSFKRPTKTEQKFLDFIEKYSLPFSYCGNGTLAIGYRFPDAYENNGRKICLEFANKNQKQFQRKILPEKYENQRIVHFAKYGWKCLVLWEEDLRNEEKLLQKIGDVLNEK